MQGKEEEKLSAALLKVALGYQVAEVTEEFAEVDGELKLTKRKRTKKDVPPDLKAVQMLLSGGVEAGLEGLSDEELQQEKQRLLTALAQAQRTEIGEGQVCDELETSAQKTVKRTAKKTAAKTKGKAKTRAKSQTSGVKKKKTEVGYDF